MYIDIKNDRIIVKVLYNEKYLNIFKTIYGHRWNAKTKLWSFPLMIDVLYELMKLKELKVTLQAEGWMKI